MNSFSNSLTINNYYFVINMKVSLATLVKVSPQVDTDPIPEIPTIEQKQPVQSSNLGLSNTNICNIEQVILKHIYEGNIDKLKELKIHMRDLNFLEEFPEDNLDKQIFPLALATAQGSVEIVRLLLQNEAIDINNSTKPQCLTALKIACSSGYYEIVELLVNQGADVSQENDQGLNSIMIKQDHRLEEESNYFENKCLCFKMAELLIENGADIDAVVYQEKQYTLLMMFCSVKEQLTSKDLQINLDVIRFLLENGADRHRLTSRGKSPVDLCQHHPQKETVLKMLADVKSKTESIKKHCFKPQLINQKQMVSMEGRQNSSSCCCTLLASTRTKPVQKQWWNIF